MQNSSTTEKSPLLKGSLTCVGTGITLAGQVTLLAQSYIEDAQIVYSLLPDHLSEQWVSSLNDNHHSLQYLYEEGKSRRTTYQEMVKVLTDSVKQGKDVVLALYGHPGIFACIGHYAIQELTEQGYQASMLPGVSADACLFADLGIDPGSSGCQAFEATQFLFSGTELNVCAHTILWQIGLAGEHTLKTFQTTQENLQATVKILNKWFPLDHELILYEAPFLPIQEPRIERFPLSELPNRDITTISTLVIPPLKKLALCEEALAEFGLTKADFNN